ncbi:hypothetical protein TNCV_5051471 [Trichonephila clavipes]|nr:hypothetical protein TNCV_5051471 [Trichonephila clavipes]
MDTPAHINILGNEKADEFTKESRACRQSSNLTTLIDTNAVGSRSLVKNSFKYSIPALYKDGWSNRHIGQNLGRSDMVITRFVNNRSRKEYSTVIGGSMRPRNANASDDCAITKAATSQTTLLESVQRHLLPSRHLVVSKETIQKRLVAGIRSRRPLRPLTPYHRQYRLDFC